MKNTVNIKGNRQAQAIAKKLGIEVKVYMDSNSWGSSVYSREVSAKDYNIIMAEIEAKEKKEEEKLLQMMAPAKIAEAIYSINKEAKRQRDIQRDTANGIWGNDYEDGYERSNNSNRGLQFHSLNRAIERKNELYDIKNKALSLLIEQEDLYPIGYHEFGEDFYGILYEYDKFSFHTISYEKPSDMPFLGSMEMVPAERKRSIPPAKAEKLLRMFIDKKVKDKVLTALDNGAIC